MADQRPYHRRSIQLMHGCGLFCLALLLSLATQWSGSAWSQERRSPPQFDSRQPSRLADPALPFGGALASCEKDQEKDMQFELPAVKGEIKLDACYRGRRQMVCRYDAIFAEERSLVDDFTRILEKNYPELSSLEAICRVSFDVLVKDLASAGEFNKRFIAAKSEYDVHNGCANKVKQQIRDVTLPDLAQAPGVLKSIVDAFDQEINRVSVVHEQVSGLAAKVEASQRVIAVLQKIHRAMCLKPEPQAPAVN